jgi:AcrR family transcriptional regulator
MKQCRLEQREARVDTVIKAALQVFAREGFHAATLEEIAETAGVNKAMLYYYVGNKEQLYELCLRRKFGKVQAELEAFSEEASSDDGGLAFALELGRQIGKRPTFFTLLFRELAPVAEPVPPVVVELLASLVALMKQHLTASRRPYLDTLAVLGIISGIYTQALVDADTPRDYDEELKHTLTTYFHGLTPAD